MDSNIFHLLADVVGCVSSLPMHLLENLQSNLTVIDAGLRTHFENSERLYDALRQAIASALHFGTVTVLRDSFCMNYVIFQTQPNTETFCALGPFLTSPHTAPVPKSNLLEAQLAVIPCIPAANVLTTATRILQFEHGIRKWQFNMIELVPKEPHLLQPVLPESSDPVIAAEIEERLTCLAENGEYLHALEEVKRLQQLYIPVGSPDISQRIVLLHRCNTLYRNAALRAGTPETFTRDIFLHCARRIDQCGTLTQCDAMHHQLLITYCDLCREYSIRQYSDAIRRVLNYIQLNLNGKLDLKTLAKHIGFSPTYISHNFKEEVGISPMHYIMQQRIRLAETLLRSTDKPVQDIANNVGISDWNYFTKVFRQHTGLTPSEYRRQKS